MNLPSGRARGFANNWGAAAVATVIGWVIPIWVRWSSRDDELSGGIALACLLALGFCVGLCRAFRNSSWVVLVWVPLLVWSGLGALYVLGAVVGEPHGGPNAAPLEGVANLLALVAAVVFGVATVLALVWRPRVYSAPLVVLAMVNTAAVSYLTREANFAATRQTIALRVLDPSGKPISGASVQWERYGYGPGGKNAFDGSGGPLISGNNGIVLLPSRSMRHEMNGVITKSGFREVLFTAGMQFSKWDKERDVIVSTRETPKIAWARIPTAEPVGFSIYLPTEADAPQSLRSFRPQRKVTGAEHLTAYLNAETGQFTDSPLASDLEFVISFEKEGQDAGTRVRVNGINGTTLQVVPFEVNLTGELSPYENVFLVAPEHGYAGTALVPIGHSPGPQIYLRAREGRFFGRAEVDAFGRADEHSANLDVQLFINPSGSRQLEGPRR